MKKTLIVLLVIIMAIVSIGCSTTNVEDSPSSTVKQTNTPAPIVSETPKQLNFDITLDDFISGYNGKSNETLLSTTDFELSSELSEGYKRYVASIMDGGMIFNVTINASGLIAETGMICDENLLYQRAVNLGYNTDITNMLSIHYRYLLMSILRVSENSADKILSGLFEQSSVDFTSTLGYKVKTLVEDSYTLYFYYYPDKNINHFSIVSEEYIDINPTEEESASPISTNTIVSTDPNRIVDISENHSTFLESIVTLSNNGGYEEVCNEMGLPAAINVGKFDYVWKINFLDTSDYRGTYWLCLIINSEAGNSVALVPGDETLENMQYDYSE